MTISTTRHAEQDAQRGGIAHPHQQVLERDVQSASHQSRSPRPVRCRNTDSRLGSTISIARTCAPARAIASTTPPSTARGVGREHLERRPPTISARVTPGSARTASSAASDLCGVAAPPRRLRHRVRCALVARRRVGGSASVAHAHADAVLVAHERAQLLERARARCTRPWSTIAMRSHSASTSSM